MMSTMCKSCFIVLLIFLSIPVYADHKYEPVENACNRCHCIEKQSTHYVLDCKAKNLMQTLASYPDVFGVNQTGKFIYISYDENEFKFLNQLAATDADVVFSCSHCQLEDIETAAFIDVPNIFRLNLSWNKLSADSLRPDIFRGHYSEKNYEPLNLVELDLAGNQIKTLQRNLFEHTKSLKWLSLAFNILDLTDMATVEALGSLRTIEYLDLSNSNLSILPAELFNETMHSIRELRISGNRFTTVPMTLTLLGGSLQNLYIGLNFISVISNDSFKGLSQLTHLFINEMAVLKEIEANALAPLHSLVVLNCSRNLNLTKFHLRGLEKARDLKVLDLSKCGLTSIDTVAVAINGKVAERNDSDILNFPALRSIRLEDNPWHCDCDLFKSLNQLPNLKSKGFESESSARCSGPFELASDLLFDLLLEPDQCLFTNNRKPIRNVKYDPPAFLRRHNIIVTILSVMAVVLIGTVIGLGIVMVKKKLQDEDITLDSTIRYTTIRNSTISTFSDIQ